MKKFRILGILTIAIIIGTFIYSFTSGWRSENESFNRVHHRLNTEQNSKHKQLNRSEEVVLSIKPLDTTPIDSLTSSEIEGRTPWKITQIRTYIEPGIMGTILNIAIGIMIFIIIYAIYSLIRLLISISKRDIFTAKNVRRIRWFTYPVAIGNALWSIKDWIYSQAAIDQVHLPGYEIIGTGNEMAWVEMMIIILLTEIFAVAVKIKEEQDLTI